MATKVKWQATEDRKKDNLDLILFARATRQEILVRVEVRNSDPLLWGEWGYPKLFGLRGSIDQCYVELNTEDLKP